MSNIVIVEKVVLRESNERAYTFQLVYFERSHQWHNNADRYYVWYLFAKTAEERDEWMEIIRNLVKKNARIAEKYHLGFRDNGLWICCGQPTKGFNSGCTLVTWSQVTNEPSKDKVATTYTLQRNSLPRTRSKMNTFKITVVFSKEFKWKTDILEVTSSAETPKFASLSRSTMKTVNLEKYNW